MLPVSILRNPWLIVALLVPVAMLNYLDRQMLASMKFSVMGDIPDIESDAHWGRMLGQFKWVYAFLSPLGGWLADRFGRRFTIGGSLFAWSAVTWWTGHVNSYSELLWARSLMGMSEAFYIPAALALISDYHLGSTRSRAVGFHQMGIYLGVIAGGFGGYVAEAPSLGWRWAFGACGLVGMLYAIPLALVLRDVRRGTSGGGEATASGSGNGSVVAIGSFILLVLYFTLPAMAAWIVRDWMPAILKSEFHIGQGKAGVSATLYWQIAAILGAIGGGWLADRWMRRTIRGRIYVSALGVSLIIPAMFGVGYAPQTGHLWVAIVFLILFGLGWGFFDTNNMPILCQIARPEWRATGYGIMNFVSISCGGFADWGFGKLLDLQVPLFKIFALFASVAALSVVLVLLIRPRPENE
ncbi:MAG: MFS transporter [Verrucomicrobiales bacterium]